MQKTNHMEYLPHQEAINSNIMDIILDEWENADFSKFDSNDVLAAISKDKKDLNDLKALLSPAAAPFLEQIAKAAKIQKEKYFGKNIYLFTPIYIANFCDNHCIYCGYNTKNKIKRQKLNLSEIKFELENIARSGFSEILLLTGESEINSSLQYIADACRIAKQYFSNVGIEIYPLNSDQYAYLHSCGVDFVTVFQETYNPNKYEKIHLAGNKRIFPYRLNTQERAIMGGMRGVAFGALLGLDDWRKDALCTALHASLIQNKYPHAEISISCPRLRPIVNNGKINPKDVGERELLQIICAYRLFLPYAGITLSTRESARFRDNAIKLGITKVSAGVSTGIGEHGGKNKTDQGDAQFEINDSRSINEIKDAIKRANLTPVMNDYLFV
nr:2-iminoacetate synthase ThiH [Campylobacter sp.]